MQKLHDGPIEYQLSTHCMIVQITQLTARFEVWSQRQHNVQVCKNGFFNSLFVPFGSFSPFPFRTIFVSMQTFNRLCVKSREVTFSKAINGRHWSRWYILKLILGQTLSGDSC